MPEYKLEIVESKRSIYDFNVHIANLPFKERLCLSLKQAYDNEPELKADIVITFPWKEKHVPKDLIDILPYMPIINEPDAKADIVKDIKTPIPRRQEILKEALKFGCEWAVEENERIKKAFAIPVAKS